MKRVRTYLIIILMVGLVFLTSCTKDDSSGEIVNNTGVILTTELSYYAEDTLRILAFWENNTEYDVMYGQPFVLERYDTKTNRWYPIPWKENFGFTMEGIRLSSGWRKKHTYNFSGLKDRLTEGQYRIKTSFAMNGKDFDIAAEFSITKDESLLDISELDFSDYENSREIPIWFLNDDSKGKTPFPVRAYKNSYTFDTTIVIEGQDYYTNIAKGNGCWGVVQGIYAFKQNKKIYLIYSFSRNSKSKEHLSYIGIFDLTTKEEIYVSAPFKNYDIAIGYKEDGLFNAAFMKYSEYVERGSAACSVYYDGPDEWIDDISDFKVLNGKVIFIN